jgi:hypothetical protein
MRTAFLVLVLANIAFFAYRYYVAHYAAPDTDPVAHQLQPERVRIVPREELARLAASRRGGPCLELGPVAAGDAARVEEAAAGLAGGLKIQRRVDDPGRWWVYIPPLPTRQAAVQRVAELKRQGIEDSALVNDEPSWRNAISLGVFRSEDAANARAETLRKRGIRGVQVAARGSAGARVYIQLWDAPGAVRLRFVDLKDGLPGSDVRECQSQSGG